MNNNNKKLLLIIIGFVVLLVGASLLYSGLSKSVATDQLAANPVQAAEKEEEAQDSVQENTEQASAENAETESAGEQEPELMLAPDFTVYDAEGNEVKLSDYFGKPTIVNFWASWCGPCQMEMPDFHEKYQELGDEVNFLMVNMTSGRETLENAKSFVEENEYTFPVFFDTDTNAAMTYSVYSLPTTYFLDENGYLIANATGAIDAATLQRGIDMIVPES